MNTIIQDQMADRKQRIEARLDKFNFPDDLTQPMLRINSVQFDLAGRAMGTAYGGLALVHQLVRKLGLAEAIDQRLHLLKVHLPYHESDHVLSLAYNALCDGRCLEDLELRRQDEAYLNLLGAERIPDPTTAGDFCRRFQEDDLRQLQAAYDVVRRRVWDQQPASFFREARIEADGTMVSEPQQGQLFDDYRYFLYLTNDHQQTPAQIVFSANDRCQQENVLAQLVAARALHAPVDSLLANGAYMLMTALAWNLKAWLALSLPAEKGESSAAHRELKQSLLGSEFRTFVNRFLKLPAQVVNTGRRIIVRLLAWNTWQPIFFRWAEAFSPSRRC